MYYCIHFRYKKANKKNTLFMQPTYIKEKKKKTYYTLVLIRKLQFIMNKLMFSIFN